MHVLDKKLKREIDSLRIHCINNELEVGCQWIGEVGSLRDHLKSANGCGYVEVECPNKCRSHNVSFDINRENHFKNKVYHQCGQCGHKKTYHNLTGIITSMRKYLFSFSIIQYSQ